MIRNPENPVKLGIVKGKIEFKNVWFAYNNDEYVLKDISFSINPGETESQLLGTPVQVRRVLLIFLPDFMISDKGEILLDGINIEKLDKRELRKYISMVLQDVFLFSGDIKSNINLRIMRQITKEVIEAARIVGADKFIEELPQKYGEEVKERGATSKCWAETADFICKSSGLQSQNPYILMKLLQVLILKLNFLLNRQLKN